MSLYCCAVCPNEVTCQDLDRATFARPEEVVDPTPTEEFCGGYKGDHFFEEGANQCRCGRAYKRAPRP